MKIKFALQRLTEKFYSVEEKFSSRSFEEAAEIFYRLRYALGGIFLLLCVLLEIHGSSINFYAKIFNHPELNINLLGVSRLIRTDEWVVFTPFAFSQYFTDFSITNDLIRGTLTNAFVVYGQAIQHLAMIFRPAQLGYLFLDQGSGLAFFWVSRLVELFLISFEFARKILNAKKSLSLLYAVMIAFSPLAQWWWAVNFTAEILFAGQGVVLFWKLYLGHNDGKRFLFAIGALWCAGIYIMSLYPAWQVPFGWTFLLCAIAVTANFSDVLKILRRDKIFWLIGLLVMLAPICHVMYISADAIAAVRATDYPGSRFEVGGSMSPLFSMFYGFSSLLPAFSIFNLTNNCEAATFFSVAPLGLLVFAIVTFRRKQLDLLMTLLVGLTFIFTLWEVVGFPSWLSKITLLFQTTDNRLRIVLDFIQMLILFRGLSLIELNFSRAEKFFLAAIISIVGTNLTCSFLGEWMSSGKIFFMTAFVFVAVYLFAGRLTNLRVGILIVMMLLIGAPVNPVAHGVDCIYELPIGQKISELVQAEVDSGKQKSLWIVEDEDMQINNFPIMFGAPTINTTNIYPALERWKKLDPDGKNRRIYNSYAHISIILTEEPTNFSSAVLGDHFNLNLNPADLHKLDVKYILSRKGDLEKFSAPKVKIKKLYENRGSFIYSVAYAT